MLTQSSKSHNTPARFPQRYRVLATLTMAFALNACGGGGGGGGGFGGGGGNGGGGSSNDWVAGVFMAASTFRGRCLAPRSGSNDLQGTTRDENNFLRSYSNDTYLWYDEIVDQDPALFTTAAYFDELVTDATTASGNNKDNFHFSLSTDDWIALSQGGASAGYGTQFALLKTMPPRQVLVAFTDPGTPAASAALARGAEILEVDGVDVVSGNDTNTLNAALFPAAAGETHEFVVRDLGAAGTRTLTITSAIVTSTPVQNVSTIPTALGNIGYLLFNDHIATAERGLFDAVNTLSAGNIVDLVIDLRYNGGGFLDIASEFSYMIAGAARTNGRTFELLTFNDKHPDTDPVTGQPITPVGFHTQSQGFDPSLAAGTPLPTLNMSRVFVLTGSGTCSASESIMNSLRGVGVQVIQVGSTTCGKPYGFYPTDNCSTTYFTIQFQGKNELGFGDYSDGFTPLDANNQIQPKLPGCFVSDDFTAALGDPTENLLATALSYAETGACPPVVSSNLSELSKTRGTDADRIVIPKSPWHQNRILRP